MLDGKFARGSTPTHQFRLPFEIDRVDQLTISYGYRDSEPIVKKILNDCDVVEDYIVLTLSQEETLAFKPESIVKVQMKVLSTTGTVVVSTPYYLKVEPTLDGEILD